MVQVRSQESEPVQLLSFSNWIQTFRPKDATSLACGIPEKYIHFQFIEKDWERIQNLDDSCVWSAVQGEGSIYLVNGRQSNIAVAYMVTEIGWDADNAFHVDVPTSGVIDGDTLDLRQIACDYACQVMQDNIINAYFFEGCFSHWYCSWCGSTCNIE